MSTEATSSIAAVAGARLDATLALIRPDGAGEVLAQIRSFLSNFDAVPPVSGYKYIPEPALSLHAGIADLGGQGAGRAFLFACLLTALRETICGGRFAQLPVRVRGHQLRQFQRIVQHDTAFLAHCHPDDDLFLKDFGLASLRLYAAASNLIDFRSGVARSLLWRGGALDLVRRAWLFARIGGFRPFFEIHVHKLYLDEFNEEGRNECYRCCVDLYAVHPEVLGMYAGSWFYDPYVPAISPRLAYLRQVPERGGATFLFDSHNEQAIRNATATSRTREALHASGQYNPASYALIWPRTEQLAWARQTGSSGQ